MTSIRNKRKRTGEELFFSYMRNDPEYADTLYMAHLELGNDLYPLLEKAESEGKKIVIIENYDKYTIDPPLKIEIK